MCLIHFNCSGNKTLKSIFLDVMNPENKDYLSLVNKRTQ